MNISQYILLFFSVFIAGYAALKLPLFDRKYLSYILSFSGAYLMGITTMHLLPEVYHDQEGSHIGVWIIVGFFIQLLTDQLTKGIEHGHIHTHGDHSGSLLLSIMIGLGLHSLLEGIPLNGYYQDGHGHLHNNSYLLGIILHHIPAAFALGLLLSLSSYKKTISIFYIALFASLPNIGALLGHFLPSEYYTILMSIVIGALLHVSTVILFETEPSSEHKVPFHKIMILMVGFTVAWLMTHQH